MRLRKLRIQVRCVGCKRKWWIDPNTVGELGPFCDVCFLPATVEKAEASR